MATGLATIDPPVKLSLVKPDFESILLQLQIYLQSKSTWIDLQTSSAGETLLELMASVTTFNLYAVESASREGFLHTAMRDSSIYAITRMLGVRINRKSPGSTLVKLVRTDNINVQEVIPKYSQFTVNSLPFFNRDVVVFGAGADTTQVRLYEGTITTQTFAADSTQFREIYLNEQNFVVSDSDVLVKVKTQQGYETTWSYTEDGLWIHTRTDLVYSDSTSGLGDTIIAFGDGIHGSLPQLGSTISITYAKTKGSAGNNASTNLPVEYPSSNTITGATLEAVLGGSDEKPSSFYKSLAPHIYKARRRAVTGTDYMVTFAQYPNVSSAIIQGQKDVAPWDLRWMNNIRVCALPSQVDADALTDAEWDALFLYMSNKRVGPALHLVKQNPKKVVKDLTITIALLLDYVPSDVIPLVEQNIADLFSRKWDTLGKRVSLSDVMGACKVEGVDYVLLDMTADFVPADRLSYIALGNLLINTRYSERTIYGDRQFT